MIDKCKLCAQCPSKYLLIGYLKINNASKEITLKHHQRKAHDNAHWNKKKICDFTVKTILRNEENDHRRMRKYEKKKEKYIFMITSKEESWRIGF
ncbi:CLUMA_CG009738, isoform A [Clunio marinus]|uniref:CLUMA_CG009738, isoform A n=1 Tax=Clunio marinus TaxID=568069 RepID=A0A1J1I7N3_9DIPT|nr:CLUMA_CG009738, isoform A [Clunio marinus]